MVRFKIKLDSFELFNKKEEECLKKKNCLNFLQKKKPFKFKRIIREEEKSPMKHIPT